MFSKRSAIWAAVDSVLGADFFRGWFPSTTVGSDSLAKYLDPNWMRLGDQRPSESPTEGRQEPTWKGEGIGAGWNEILGRLSSRDEVGQAKAKSSQEGRTVLFLGYPSGWLSRLGQKSLKPIALLQAPGAWPKIRLRWKQWRIILN